MGVFSPTCQVRVVRFYVRCPAPPPPSSPSPSSPDLHCQLSIAVGLAGPPLPALDRGGPHRASTGKSERCGPRRRDSARRGPRRAATGPQRPETKPYRMPKRMPDRMSEDMPDRMSEDMPDRYAR